MAGRRHFGTVRKLPSSRYQAGYWHEGARHTASETFAAKTDALAYLSTVEADIRRGAWIDPRAGTVTLGSYARTWLERRPDLAVRTNELYAYLLAHHVLPNLGDSTLAALSPSKVRGWHAELASRHPSTAAKSYRLLSTIMRTAVADGLILKSPCHVKGAAVEKAPERPVVSVAEIGALAGGMPERLRALVLLAAWCQLRRGELLGLQRRDIDLVHATVSVERSRTVTMTGGTVLKGPKTSAGRRVLSIPPNVVDDLVNHLERFTGPDPDAPLFTGEKGHPLALSTLTQTWKRARSTIGRPELHLHDLRHAGLTLAAVTGATTAELMHRAGHSSPAAALRYQHATRERDKVLAQALAELNQPVPVIPLRDAAKL